MSTYHLLSTSSQYIWYLNKLEAATTVIPSQWRPGLSPDTTMAQLDYKGLVSIHGLFKLTELVTSNNGCRKMSHPHLMLAGGAGGDAAAGAAGQAGGGAGGLLGGRGVAGAAHHGGLARHQPRHHHRHPHGHAHVLDTGE